MMLYYLSSMIYMFISVSLMLLSLNLMMMKVSYFMEWSIYLNNSVSMNMYIYIDWVMLMFMFTVLFISSVIMMYSSEYMSMDLYSVRFFYLMMFFILSMLLLIISPSMISMLIGWDGLGLISYCLVIYYQNVSSYNSGMITVLLNRIGDVMILLGISVMFITGGWNYMNMSLKGNLILLLFIMIASFTKSAQFPFSSWLPAAMAAPTPVSSLVHSSTLVTAGVYMLIRFNSLIYSSELLLKLIMMIGLITMMMAGFSASLEYDLKKIIAFSTLSQLGLMVMIFGMKNWELAYFHLIIHAMFKSLMFMCSGILIHSMMNIQDIRFMGLMKLYYPMTYMMLMVSNMSLCGMPFMSGYYSKDQILETMMMAQMNLASYTFMMLSTGLTVYYSVRVIYFLMFKSTNYINIISVSEVKVMNLPMMLLVLMSVIFGNLMNWLLFMNMENIYMLGMEKVLIMLVCFMFMAISKMLFKISKVKCMYKYKFFAGKMWFLYNFIPLIIINPMNISKLFSLVYELGWSEMWFKKSMVVYFKNFNKIDSMNNNNNLILLMLSSVMVVVMLMFM